MYDRKSVGKWATGKHAGCQGAPFILAASISSRPRCSFPIHSFLRWGFSVCGVDGFSGADWGVRALWGVHEVSGVCGPCLQV